MTKEEAIKEAIGVEVEILNILLQYGAIITNRQRLEIAQKIRKIFLPEIKKKVEGNDK